VPKTATASPGEARRCIAWQPSSAANRKRAAGGFAIQASGRPLLVSNVDLSDMGVGGSRQTFVARFLTQFAEGAGLTCTSA